ncbi:S-adenosyl-L-methionine-dependent methyltransferase [Jimgerdemannia flammicorona]|uniref:S-adenosyl-L-methionine-dependent methyltransferase n=1 Tax=Jimgerdemannia flammicorona TaxID=994334 RepID=A0A433Q7I9_9FUNG|nr:S-adenosyl-L-methionine-dependent methyltransferase [Jimgerdemannia flammicorona]
MHGQQSRSTPTHQFNRLFRFGSSPTCDRSDSDSDSLYPPPPRRTLYKSKSLSDLQLPFKARLTVSPSATSITSPEQRILKGTKAQRDHQASPVHPPRPVSPFIAALRSWSTQIVGGRPRAEARSTQSESTKSESSQIESSSKLNHIEKAVEETPSFNKVQERNSQKSSRLQRFYIMPNTVEEAQRLSALGELLKGALENNYLPPINVKLLGDAKVLDVGCGPETWATELARKYPSSRVTAIDLVETAGPRPDRPPNYQFLIADALQPLPFPDNTFDFVHMRLMSHAFSAADWKPVLKELKRVMKPGGWIQMIEADQRMYYISGAGVEGKKTMDKVIHTLAARGQLTDVANVLDKLLRKSGYADITTNYVSIPVGSWGGRLGYSLACDIRQWFTNIKPWFSNILSLDTDEYDHMVDSLIDECNSTNPYINYHYVFGTKPAVS